LDRLEATLGALVERLDAPASRRSTSPRRQSSQPEDAPPVFMIRDVANELGVHSPNESHVRGRSSTSDLLTKAGIQPAVAQTMLDLSVSPAILPFLAPPHVLADLRVTTAAGCASMRTQILQVY
jgi:hypothetical protein